MAAFMAILLVGAAGCASGDSESGPGDPNRLAKTVNGFRAHLAQYRPDFLGLKSSTDLGYRALAVKDYKKAMWHLEFEVENKPDNPAPRLYLGQVYAETGRTEEAQAMYRSAAALGPATTVKLDAANLGRPVSEVAAERLAVLTGPSEALNKTVSSRVEADFDEQNIFDETMVPGEEPQLTVSPMTDIAPVMAPPPEEVPETIVITSASEQHQTGPLESGEPIPTVAIHLASYKSRTKADAGWRILTRRYADLSILEPVVVEADLGAAKGIYFRLVADGLHSPSDARDLCRALKAKGHDWCQVGTVSQ